MRQYDVPSRLTGRFRLRWPAPILAPMLLAAVFALSCGAGTEAPSIRVGVAETIITPPVGAPMAGYAREGVSTAVHDDLYARSLAVEGADGAAAVLMTLGIINLPRSLFDRIRAGVSEQTGIPVGNIVLSCTHTHSGPSVRAAGEDYQELLVSRSVESAVLAWGGRVPGRIGTGSTELLELGRNDRRLGYGGLHPDPEVGIVRIEDAGGNLMGVDFNFGCHPSTLDLHNLEFTEDWPCYGIRGIKEELGEDIWVAYYQSAQGDVKVGYTAELSAVGAEMPIRNFWWAEVKGRQMAEAVLDALPGIETSGDPVVAAADGFYNYPLRESYPITVQEAEEQDRAAKERIEELENKAGPIGKRVLDRARVEVFLTGLALGCARWVENNPDPKPQSMEHQAVRIGDSVFATFPCEVFSEIGLKVKQASPLEKTFVIGVAAGHGGYIPTADEYLEGGYAAVMTRYSSRCERVCIDASLEMIGKVHP